MSVAVITRTKNRPLLLRRALESVLAQTHSDWVHIVVNDGGDPARVEQAIEPLRARYAGRIQLLHHPVSLGMEAASNAGIRASGAELVALLDDDDSWDPAFLAEAAAFLSDNRRLECGGVATQTVVIHEALGPDGVPALRSKESWNASLTQVSLFQMAAHNLFTNNAFVFRRAHWAELGGFNEQLPVLGDWEFNLRFLERWNIGMIARPLANYHRRASAPEGDYSNSTAPAHQECDAWLRNELLRRDLQSGKFGLGALVNLSKELEQQRRRQLLLENHVQLIGNGTRAIEGGQKTLAQAVQLLLKHVGLG